MCNALVDDRGADFGQSVNIGFARPKVTALDGVVEKAIDAVAVILIVLRGVYSALRSDRMRPARAILIAKTVDVEPLLAKRCRGGAPG